MIKELPSCTLLWLIKELPSCTLLWFCQQPYSWHCYRSTKLWTSLPCKYHSFPSMTSGSFLGHRRRSMAASGSLEEWKRHICKQCFFRRGWERERDEILIEEILTFFGKILFHVRFHLIVDLSQNGIRFKRIYPFHIMRELFRPQLSGNFYLSKGKKKR